MDFDLDYVHSDYSSCREMKEKRFFLNEKLLAMKMYKTVYVLCSTTFNKIGLYILISKNYFLYFPKYIILG